VDAMTRWLALIASAIVSTAAALTALGATVEPAPRPTVDPAPRPTYPADLPALIDTARRPATRAAVEQAATRAAVRYALAARNWSARTARAAWRHQQALAAGRLRRELNQTRPTRAQVAALKAERGSQLAVPVGTPRPRVTSHRAEVLVTLAERTATRGRAVTYRTRNRAILTRTPSGWRVTGWTVLPTSEPAR